MRRNMNHSNSNSNRNRNSNRNNSLIQNERIAATKYMKGGSRRRWA